MSEQSDSESEFLGISHFLDFMYGGEPEWSLFAIRAPINEVSAALAQIRKAKSTAKDVPCQPADGDGDELAHLVAVVKLKDNPWTDVFRSLLWVDASHLEDVTQEAKELSARFKTRAITFFTEDTSGAMGYEIFENGRSLESAEWENGGDEFAEKLFREQGIYLPSCYPKSEDGRKWLAVDKISASMIERADLIELP